MESKDKERVYAVYSTAVHACIYKRRKELRERKKRELPHCMHAHTVHASQEYVALKGQHCKWPRAFIMHVGCI